MDKIICVGKNYLKHAQELGDAIPEEPVYFIKPPSTLVEIAGSAEVEWPSTGELHHELELVLRLGREHGEWTFTHYSFGLDMTLRDVQAKLKKAGLPWEKAKTFQNSSITGQFLPLENLNQVMDLPFRLTINGQRRQEGRGQDMRWKPLELVSDLQRWFPLREGDLLFTGTPEGVGPVNNGDMLEISGGGIRYQVTARRS